MLRRSGLAKVPRAVLFCSMLLCIVLVAMALINFWPTGSATQGFELSKGSDSTAASTDVSEDIDFSSEIKVDVEGAVKKPGLYTLSSQARVGEAIEAAGGFKKKAARTTINLAQKLEDASQVYVQTKRQVKAQNELTQTSGGTTESTSVASSGAIGADAGKVNLNTATLDELQTLSGVGPVLAQAIIDYRTENGNFTKVEDIKNVSGIGDARYSNLKDHVCV